MRCSMEAKLRWQEFHRRSRVNRKMAQSIMSAIADDREFFVSRHIKLDLIERAVNPRLVQFDYASGGSTASV